MSGSYSMSKSSSNPKDITPNEYRSIRPQLGNMLGEYIWGGPEYKGPMVAGMTGDEVSGLSDIKSQASTDSPLSRASRGETMSTLAGNYLRPDSNPFLREYIDAATRPITQRAEEQRLSSRADFGAAGQRISQSSPFARAAAIRDRGELDAISSATADIGSGAYEAERGRMSGAVTASEAITKGKFDRSMESLKAAALPRLIEQLGIDNGMKEFARRAQIAIDAAGIAGDISSLFGVSSKSKSSSTSGGIG